MIESTIFATFVRRWVASAEAVDGDRLISVESAMQVTFPAAYRRFVLQHGTPFCPKLLDAIVDGEHDLHDVQDFTPVGELAEATATYESGGMEPGFVGFATDCMGNMFLFSRVDCAPGADDAPVWFFDHDFVSIEEEAPSFVEWLHRYARMGSGAEG